MVGNFLAGGAAINALARQCGAEVNVVDVGVAAELRRPHRQRRTARERLGARRPDEQRLALLRAARADPAMGLVPTPRSCGLMRVRLRWSERVARGLHGGLRLGGMAGWSSSDTWSRSAAEWVLPHTTRTGANRSRKTLGPSWGFCAAMF